MSGIKVTHTDGTDEYIATGCVYCRMDSAGNHAYDCPTRSKMFNTALPLCTISKGECHARNGIYCMNAFQCEAKS